MSRRGCPAVPREDAEGVVEVVDGAGDAAREVALEDTSPPPREEESPPPLA